MVYERRRREDSSWHEAEHSSESIGSQSHHSEYEPSPRISEEEHQRWLQQLEASRELDYFDSLPVFDLPEADSLLEFATNSSHSSEYAPPKSNRARQQPNRAQEEGSGNLPPRKKKENTAHQEQKKQESENPNKLTREEKLEEEKKQKPKKPKPKWLPWLPLGDREAVSGQQSEAPGQPQSTLTQKPPSNITTNSPSEGQKSTAPSDRQKRDGEQARRGAKENRSASNSTTSPIKEANTTPHIPQLAAPPQKQIFIAPDLATARQLNSDLILGKTSEGSVLYTSSHPQSNFSLAAEQGLSTSQLPDSSVNAFSTQQQASATEAIGGVYSQASTTSDSVTTYSENSLKHLSAQIENINHSIEEQILEQKQIVASLMTRSRQSITSATQKSIANWESQHNATITAIDHRASAAREQLTTQYQSVLRGMDEASSRLTPLIDGTLSKTENFFDVQQQRWFDTIDITERGYINRFNKQSPPESENVIGKALEKIDRESYVANWREAKVQATQSVAHHFREQTLTAFEGHFAQLALYRSTVIEGARQLASAKKLSLTTQYQSALALIQQQALSAKAQANRTLTASIKGITQQQQQQLASIDTTEASAKEQIETTGSAASTSITQLGVRLHSNLAKANGKQEQNFHRLAFVFAQQIEQNQKSDVTSLAQVPDAAKAAKAEIKNLEALTQGEIETATNSAIEQLQTPAHQINGVFSKMVSSVSHQQLAAINNYQTSLQQTTSSISNQFDSLSHQTSQAINRTTSSTTKDWATVSDSLWDNLIAVNHNLQGKLELAQSQIWAQKENFNLKLGSQIRQSATSQAALVQPIWKKVALIVVNVVITVAVTVAIAALALSGVGLVAGIGLAALIGAAGGVAKLGITNAIDGKQTTPEEYLKAAGIGAATGVLEFVGARAVVGMGSQLGSGVLTKVEHGIASTAVEALTNTTVELTERLANGEDLTLALLGISVASSLLSTAGGKYIDAQFGEIAQGAAKGAGREGSEEIVDGIGGKVVEQGWKMNTAQWATETVFDAGVETGASAARGEEITLSTWGENLAGGVMGLTRVGFLQRCE